jgi:5-methylcytosine-specific restriction endonuclease McrA
MSNPEWNMYLMLRTLAFPEVRERHNATCRKWYADHRAYVLRTKKQYFKSNPEKRRAKEHRDYHARPMIDPAIKAVYARCRELRQWFDVVVDHIVPMGKGGTHTVDNLQIIYRAENDRKAQWLNYNPQIVFR